MFEKKNARLVLIGLDAAGKSSILYKLKFGETVSSLPTIGFNVETVDFKNMKFTIWDIGGQKKIRMMWQHYYDNQSGIIFAIDSSDKDRL